MADEKSIKELREELEDIAAFKKLSAKEYFAVLKLAISRKDNYFGIFEKSSYDTICYLANYEHKAVYELAIKIVKDM